MTESDKEQEDLPKFDFKSLGVGKSVNITVDGIEPIANGSTQYGEWNLWMGMVEDEDVVLGRKPNLKYMSNYTGKVVFFPSGKTHPQIVKCIDGKDKVKINIKKIEEMGRSRSITRYVVTKVGEGVIPSSSTLPADVTEQETQIINDATILKKDGYDISEELFIKTSLSPQYGTITTERAKELFKHI